PRSPIRAPGGRRTPAPTRRRRTTSEPRRSPFLHEPKERAKLSETAYSHHSLPSARAYGMRCVLGMAGVRIGGVVREEGAQISFECTTGDAVETVDLTHFTAEQLQQLADLAGAMARQINGTQRRVIRKVLKRCWSAGGEAWTPRL